MTAAGEGANAKMQTMQPMTAPSEPQFPYVALSAQAAGIHPSTGRLLTLDAVTFDDAGRAGETFYQVFNPGRDPGPRHTHGLEVGDFAQAPRFSRSLRSLDKLIDGRVLVLHNSPLDWGYMVSESRRAMNAAARANRSRRGRGNRRRQRAGHVPRPTEIVDLLAPVRLPGHIPVDSRLPALAALAGVEVPAPAAEEEQRSRQRTLTLVGMFLALRSAGELASFDPADLDADRFGLQRSSLRVDAEKAAAAANNPGVYSPATGLIKGMEMVVTDDVPLNPDELIDAGVRAGLTYSEKLSRQSSVVVSDAPEQGAELVGKAMHAHRKDIPILSAAQFQRAVEEMDSQGSGAAE